MDSSDCDSDSECNRKSLFVAVSDKQQNGRELSEKERCTEVQRYLEEGADINAVDETGNTVLHIAVRGGFDEVVKFLLEKGARSHIKNNQGESAMTLADSLRKLEIVEIFEDFVGKPDSPSASTSRIQRLDNRENNCESVSLRSDRKRSARIKIVNSFKELKLATTNKLMGSVEKLNLCTKALRANIPHHTNQNGVEGRFVDSGGSPSSPLAGTSGTQRCDNPREDSRSVSKRLNRKRTTDTECIRGSDKELKMDTTDGVRRSSRFGSRVITFEQENQRHEENIGDFIHLDPDNKTTYPASGAKNSLHGVIYQLKHLMLVLNRAHKLGYAFRLATEMDSAEKFDDLVIEYKDREGRRAHHFVQMKHKQDNTKLIRVGDLLADDTGEFSVRKYFTSWRKVKKHPDFAKSELKSFILCTNIGLDVEDLINEEIDVIPVADEQADDFLKVTNREEQPPRYKLRPSRESDLYAQLKSASDVHLLAKAMAKRIHDAKEMNLKTDIFKRYHAALGQEILVDHGKKKRKFSDAFIKKNGLSSKAENFREIFFTYVKQFPSNRNSSDTDIWKKLNKKVLTTSGTFGKSTTLGSQPNQPAELPDDNIVDEEITDFFDEFILAVDQPNEEDLSEMIKHELGETSRFNLLNTDFIGDSFQNQILNWFKAKQGVFLVREDADNFFEQIENELSSLITVGINLPYPVRLKKYNVKFKQEIKVLEEFLNGSALTKSQILVLLSSGETLLTALKVFQTVGQLEEYQKNDSFIFIELENLVLPDIRDRVFRAFQSPLGHNLLVVDCGLDSSKRDKVKLYKQMSDMMKKLRKKKIQNKRIIVIISQTDNWAIRSKVGYLTTCEACDDTSIDELEKSSLRRLLEKRVVKFQGRNKKLSFIQLLGTEMFDDAGEEKLKEYGQIISPRTLAKLILGDEIRTGVPVQGLGDVSDYYISRTINWQVVFDSDILKIPNMPDMFAISSIVEEDSVKMTPNTNGRVETHSQLESSHRNFQKEYTILKNSQETDDFDTLCQLNPNKNIHWLQANCKSEKCMWVKSFGSVRNLVQYKVEDNHDVQDAIKLTDDQLAEHDEQRKIVIISDTAGMGKSTVLTHLAQKIMENEPSLLVIKVNLTEHTNAFDTEQTNPTFDSNDTNGAINFLVNKLVPNLESEETMLLKTMIKAERKAALLFDGFDEISPNYTRTVIDLLQALAKLDVKKLFVTTRPHTSRALEEALGVFSHTLQPFSEENQVDFLTKFWNRGLRTKVQPKTDGEGSLRSYAHAVIKLLTRSIDQSMKEFTGVPLQTRLVAESFSSNQFGLPETINIIELYRLFVEKKYQIFMTEKGRVDLTNLSVQTFSQCKQSFLQMHQKFALKLLFDKATVAKLLRTQRIGNGDKDTSEDISEDRQRTGIVTWKSNGKLQFIHRTFAEYFAAEFLVKTLINDSENRKVRKFFMEQFFVRPEYQTTRAFTNGLLASQNNVPTNKSWYSGLIGARHEVKSAIDVAVEEQNLEIVKFFVNVLEHYTLKLFASESGITLLHLASSRGYLDLVTLMIEKGGDMKSTNCSGNTLLCEASSAGQLDVVKHLLQIGADIEAPGSLRRTPLHLACMNGKLSVVIHLLEKGANIEARDRLDQTPLSLASKNGKLSVVIHLLEKGANIEARDKRGRTPLRFAAHQCQLDVMDHLLEKGANIEVRDKRGWTPLRYAAHQCQLDVMDHLLEKGANIEARDEDGNTTLIWSVHRGDLTVAMHLLAKGANIDAQNRIGTSPLILAVTRDPLGYLVEKLLEKGANVEARLNNGKTALVSAVISRKFHSVWLLLEKGANIEAHGKDGRTPLIEAISCGDLSIVEVLLHKGANTEARDASDRTPLRLAICRNQFDMVTHLLDKGANIEAYDEQGYSPLHLAVQFGNIEIMQYLIHCGANINLQTKDGFTPLRLAARRGNSEVINYLVQQGAR